MKIVRPTLVVLASCVLAGIPAAGALAPAPALGNGNSFSPEITRDATKVVFASDATNLAPGDTNGKRDIYVRDTVAKTTRRASVSATGALANGGSYFPSISDNGRYVVFTSDASNLVPGDTNGKRDVFRKDMVTGAIARVSVGVGGKQANGASDGARTNAAGTIVIFTSAATNLVSGDTNAKKDAFVRDLTTGTTKRVSMLGSKQITGDVFPSVDISSDGKVASWGYASACAGVAQHNLLRWSKVTSGSVLVDSNCIVDAEYDEVLMMTKAYNAGVAGVWSNGRGAGETIQVYGSIAYTYENCSDMCRIDLDPYGSPMVANDALGPNLEVAGKGTAIAWREGDVKYGVAPALASKSQIAYQTSGTPNQIVVWNYALDTATTVSVSNG